MAIRANGTLVFADKPHHRLCMLDEDEDVFTTIAGDGKVGFGDGEATAVSICHPSAVCCDAADRVFFAEEESGNIKCLDSTGQLTNIHPGKFTHITSMAIDWMGQIWACDSFESRLVCFAPPHDGAGASPGLSTSRLRNPCAIYFHFLDY